MWTLLSRVAVALLLLVPTETNAETATKSSRGRTLKGDHYAD